jgi:hypothetical protein
MNHTYEVESLAAETLALQAVVIAIFGRLASANPGLREAIVLGFDDAANYVEHLTIKLGKIRLPLPIPVRHSKSSRVFAPQRSARQATRNTEFNSLGSFFGFLFHRLLHLQLVPRPLVRRVHCTLQSLAEMKEAAYCF